MLLCIYIYSSVLYCTVMCETGSGLGLGCEQVVRRMVFSQPYSPPSLYTLSSLGGNCVLLEAVVQWDVVYSHMAADS